MNSGQRVLFIDDDPDTLTLCAHIFRKRGFSVMIIDGCNNLLEVVEQFSPRLIFMDHNMPKLCGAEAVKLLKLHDSYKHIPVILFSAESDIEKLAKEAGANGYLKKPFKIETIIEAALEIITTD